MCRYAGAAGPEPIGCGHPLEFARSMVDELVVVVGTELDDGIVPISSRVKWLRQHFGDQVRVEAIDLPRLDETAGLALYAERWRAQVIACLNGRKPDGLFASEPYGRMMAAMLACAFVEVDVDRKVVPISATEVRSNPVRHWHLILPEVRADLLRNFSCICDDDAQRRALASEARRRLGISVVEEASVEPGTGTSTQIARVRAAHRVAASIARGGVLLCVPSEVAAQVPELLGTTFKIIRIGDENGYQVDETGGGVRRSLGRVTRGLEIRSGRDR